VVEVATLTIRGLDDDVRERLRARAAEHGRSMEAEIRAILTSAVTAPSGLERGLGTFIHSSFADAGLTVELDLPPRSEHGRAADFSDEPGGPDREVADA